jgi:hypothetical protein
MALLSTVEELNETNMMLSETYLIIQETNMITSRDKYDVK